MFPIGCGFRSSPSSPFFSQFAVTTPNKPFGLSCSQPDFVLGIAVRLALHTCTVRSHIHQALASPMYLHRGAPQNPRRIPGMPLPPGQHRRPGRADQGPARERRGFQDRRHHGPGHHRQGSGAGAGADAQGHGSGRAVELGQHAGQDRRRRSRGRAGPHAAAQGQKPRRPHPDGAGPGYDRPRGEIIDSGSDGGRQGPLGAGARSRHGRPLMLAAHVPCGYDRCL